MRQSLPLLGTSVHCLLPPMITSIPWPQRLIQPSISTGANSPSRFLAQSQTTQRSILAYITSTIHQP